MPTKSPFGEPSEFERLCKGKLAELDFDLARIALEIARDHDPAIAIDEKLAYLDGLAERVRRRTGRNDSPRRRLGHVNWVLYVEEGFRGNHDDYYDPRNSDLNEVIDRKLGIPLTLSLIYWRVASKVGLQVGGLNTPSHFLLRVEAGRSDPIFVDPFHEGTLLDRVGCVALLARIANGPVALTDDHFQACSAKAVIVRMLRNLKSIYLGLDDFPSLLPIQQRLTALLPENPIEQRHLGMLCCHLERFNDAVKPLEAFVAALPDHPEAETAKALLRGIRRDIAARN